MKQTKQLMQQVMTQDIIELTDEQAVQLFRETNDSRIIAKYFLSLYPTLSAIVSKSVAGCEEDRVSAVLSAIMKALNTYDSSKGAKLTSYITTLCRYGVQLVYWDNYVTKGKKNCIVNSLDAMREFYDDEDFEQNILSSELNRGNTVMDNAEFTVMIENCGLSEIQVRICKRIILDTKSKPSEVCTDLCITMNEYNRHKNSLRKKLKFLLNY